MNLAMKDIRHNLSRFTLTAVGIGLLLMIVMGMGGIYRGLIEEATLVVDTIGADLWIVQRGTKGPFAEISRVPRTLEDRVRAVSGVRDARSFVTYSLQRDHNGSPLRMQAQGLSWPEDKGDWTPIIAGRALRAAHYEVITDKILGLRLGEKLHLGKNDYTVVGITSGMTSTGGDGLAFFTLLDSLDIQFDYPGEAIRMERKARRGRIAKQDIGSTLPPMVERAELPSGKLAAIAPPMVSAILARLEPGADRAAVVANLSGWADISVHTKDEQLNFLLQGMVDRARRQLKLFRTLLIIISTIIMALIIYTLTLDKTHDIAMLKLMGAGNGVILNLILQQALILGAIGYVIAYYAGTWLFPLFPRKVVVVNEDLVTLGIIVIGISILGAGLGIWKAMRVEPNEVLS